MMSFTLMEIRVADGVSIMGHQMMDSFCAYKNLSHFAQLACGLFSCHTMNSKAILGVIDQTGILSGLVNADAIHKTIRVDYISSDLAINLNEQPYVDLFYFIFCLGILKSVP